MEITAQIAARVLEVVDAGLRGGLGKPIPGQMCVEAAVCYALNLPHGDNPACVSRALRGLKIRLNDARWSSPKARANGLRRLAVAQLGSAGALDDKEFARRVAELAVRKSAPEALRKAASVQKDTVHKTALLDAASRCEKEGTRDAAAFAAYAARAATDAAAYGTAAYAGASAAATYAAAYAAAARAATYADASAAAARAATYAATYAAGTSDQSLAAFAEAVVQILIEMKAPGCQWLTLTETI